MTKTSSKFTHAYKKWFWPNIVILSTIAVSSWAWLVVNQDNLPLPGSKAGKSLLRQYQGTTHDIFIALIIISSAWLIKKIWESQKREQQNEYPKRQDSLVKFIKENPLTFAIMVGYTCAMIHETTYLYRDLVGWYPELMGQELLNNFSIRRSLISETMRRSNYRFFPLAHQDLHILSWFTIQIKVWMLYVAGQLFAIAILATRFTERLFGSFPKKTTGLLQVIIVLLLFQPATGNTFFQVIYCERTLTLLFMIYIHCLLEHEQTRSKSSAYKAILVALIGIFTKDTAIILFATPPSLALIQSALQRPRKNVQEWINQNKLSITLISLVPVFLISFIFLSLLPSIYAANKAYGNPSTFVFIADARFYFLIAITAARLFIARRNKSKLNLLDSINIAAIAYSIAIGLFAKFDSSDYLTFPVQVVILLNAGWVWTQCIATRVLTYCKSRQVSALGFIFSAILITLEHIGMNTSFATIVREMKHIQKSTQETYNALGPITKSIKHKGEEVNIIINRDSRLSRDRHMNRLRYDRLIEYYPKSKIFWIKDGISKGNQYTPKAGDIVANIDKNVEIISPIVKNRTHEILYRHNETEKSGLIVRIVDSKQPSK